MSNQDDFAHAFDRYYSARRRRMEEESGNTLSHGAVAQLRTEIREELRHQYPEQVAAIDHYHARNLEYSRNTGRPFPTQKEMEGDALWLEGANLELRLRSLTIARGKQERKPSKGKAISPAHEAYKETLQKRVGNLRGRYLNMIKKFGYVPNDIVVEVLAGITLVQARELRASLMDEFNLTEHQQGEDVPEAFRPYWIATPKEDSTARLVSVIQGLGESDRRALIELLASIKNGNNA